MIRPEICGIPLLQLDMPNGLRLRSAGHFMETQDFVKSLNPLNNVAIHH